MTKLEEMLDGVKSLVILGHVNPDGDCAGSCLAMYNYAASRDPQMYIRLYLQPIPEKFAYLEGYGQIRSEVMEEEPFDLCVCLDSGDRERLGEFGVYLESARQSLCIDHHVTGSMKSEEAGEDLEEGDDWDQE